MTATDMSYEFNIVYESIASMAAPGYTEREKSVLLTQAQEEIIIEVAQKGLDSNDYARVVLDRLLTEYNNTNNTVGILADTTLINNNSYSVTVTPASATYTFFYPFIEFAVTANPTYQRVCKPVDFDSYYTTISNPWSNPYNDMYWRLISNNKLIIVTDGKALDSIKGLYIRKPQPIITATTPTFSIDGVTNIATIDSALNPIVHREIVYRAAKKAFAAVKDQVGYQTQNNEENKD